VVRVNIVVEGQTEETFVRDVLGPFLGAQGVFVTARSVETGRKKNRIYRGGTIDYEQCRGDIELWLKQDSAHVSTMFDLYALPQDFPGAGPVGQFMSGVDRALAIELAIRTKVGSRRFMPYIQVFEFEALLFSDVHATDEALQVFNMNSQLNALTAMRAAFANPEEIDDGVLTAPSKRIQQLYPAYQKRVFGPEITKVIGIDHLRTECQHFGSWVTRLEQLATAK